MQDLRMVDENCFTFDFTTENNVTLNFEMRQLYDLATDAPLAILIGYGVNGEWVARGQRVIANQFILPYHLQERLQIGNLVLYRGGSADPYLEDNQGGLAMTYLTREEVQELRDTAGYVYG